MELDQIVEKLAESCRKKSDWERLEAHRSGRVLCFRDWQRSGNVGDANVTASVYRLSLAGAERTQARYLELEFPHETGCIVYRLDDDERDAAISELKALVEIVEAIPDPKSDQSTRPEFIEAFYTTRHGMRIAIRPTPNSKSRACLRIGEQIQAEFSIDGLRALMELIVEDVNTFKFK